VDFWHSYFDSKGNQRQKNSQLVRDTQVKLFNRNIVPDGNFRLDMLDGESRLFTLELHKGRNTKTIIKQLETHAQLIERELLPIKYDHPHDNYILSVYDTAGTMEAVKRRFLDSKLLAEYQDYYIFNTVEQVTGEFSQRWHYFNNEPFLIFR
jgi:galactose mutarotase-like enzyme